MSRLPNVHIRLLPLAPLAYAGSVGPFQILSLGGEDDEDNAVLYEESATRDAISHVPSEVRFRRAVFERLWGLSRSEDASQLAIIAQAASRRSKL